MSLIPRFGGDYVRMGGGGEDVDDRGSKLVVLPIFVNKNRLNEYRFLVNGYSN